MKSQYLLGGFLRKQGEVIWVGDRLENISGRTKWIVENFGSTVVIFRVQELPTIFSGGSDWFTVTELKLRPRILNSFDTAF